MYITQEDIIQDCIKGKRQAQKMIYDKYYRKMLGICQRYSSSKAEAEDIMLMGFMNIFSRIKSFTGSGSFESWMKKVMVNSAIDNFRKQKKYKDHLNIEDHTDEISLSTTDFHKIDKEDILKMLWNLPAGYRIVFNLFAIEGYKHEEIAEMLNISVNTSKTQLFKARKMLQEYVSLIESPVKKTKHE